MKQFGGLRIDQAKRQRAVKHARGALGRERLSERPHVSCLGSIGTRSDSSGMFPMMSPAL